MVEIQLFAVENGVKFGSEFGLGTGTLSDLNLAKIRSLLYVLS